MLAWPQSSVGIVMISVQYDSLDLRSILEVNILEHASTICMWNDIRKWDAVTQFVLYVVTKTLNIDGF